MILKYIILIPMYCITCVVLGKLVGKFYQDWCEDLDHLDRF